MIKWFLKFSGLLPVILVISCLHKKEENKKFISIPSLIHEQVAFVDTSLFPIRKVVITDSLHSDTTFIKRENFGVEAKDFLALPDMSDKKIAKRFAEEPARFDETLNRVILTYLPVKPEEEEIKKQEILIQPDPINGDKVTTIIISRLVRNRNGLFQQELLWQMNKSFQEVTTTQLPGQPEKTITTRVIWNDEDDQ